MSQITMNSQNSYNTFHIFISEMFGQKVLGFEKLQQFCMYGSAKSISRHFFSKRHEFLNEGIRHTKIVQNQSNTNIGINFYQPLQKEEKLILQKWRQSLCP